jgi:hypothetical protein
MSLEEKPKQNCYWYYRFSVRCAGAYGKKKVSSDKRSDNSPATRGPNPFVAAPSTARAHEHFRSDM